MADALDAKANVAVAAAASAATQTAAVIAQTEAIAERVVEHAAERVAAAEKVTEQIADAALMTALGNQVRELEGRITSWQSETAKQISTLTMDLAAAQAAQVATQTQLTEALVRLTLQPQPANPQAPPTETVVTEMPVEAVENAETTLENVAAPVERQVRRVWR